jgi:hypothetical protein
MLESTSIMFLIFKIKNMCHSKVIHYGLYTIANWCLWKKNQMLIGLVFFISIDAHLPKSFWRKLVIYKIDFLPKALSNKTPIEMWFGITPNLFYWRVFRCHS